MLTIEDLKGKLAWETPDDIIDLLEVDIITVLYLEPLQKLSSKSA